MDDLTVEAFACTRNVRQQHLDRLLSLGVTSHAMAALGSRQPPFGVTTASLHRSGLWHPDEGGDPVLVIPVCDEASLLRWGLEIDDVETIDLVALRTTEPSRWWWRTGDAWALGLHLLDAGRPVEVVSDPIQWLAKAGKAIVVLNWNARAICWRALLDAPLIIPDRRLRTRICDTFMRIAPMPELIASAA